MQTKTVKSLPVCTECIADERTPPNDAEFRVKTPTKTTSFLCGEHFMDYVEQRLGVGTVEQLVIVQHAGGGRKKDQREPTAA